MKLTEKQIDAIAKKYSGIGGVDDYRAFAREIATIVRNECAFKCEQIRCETYDLGTDERRAWNEATICCAEMLKSRCTEERPCINCFADIGQCLGPNEPTKCAGVFVAIGIGDDPVIPNAKG